MFDIFRKQYETRKGIPLIPFWHKKVDNALVFFTTALVFVSCSNNGTIFINLTMTTPATPTRFRSLFVATES